ncbi:hypothetical protein ACC771_07550, partial [Rhizobium ruizarguesonis]
TILPGATAASLAVPPPTPLGDGQTPVMGATPVQFIDDKVVVTAENLDGPGKLYVRYVMGDAEPIDVLATVYGGTAKADVPSNVILGLADISLVRKVDGLAFDAAGVDRSEPIELESGSTFAETEQNR